MEWMFVVVVVALILLALIKTSTHTEKRYRYRQRGPLFSAAERSFLSVLDHAVADDYRIFGKVRVADVISPAKGANRKNWQIAFNKISSKHFDYVLCSKDKLEIVAVIELDDKSHKTKKVIKRDALLESACESAALKLVRFQAKSTYQLEEIEDKIELALNPRDTV